MEEISEKPSPKRASTPSKEKRQKGKRMLEERKKTRALELEIQAVENRINYIKREQEKLNSNNKIFQSFTLKKKSIREEYEKFKQNKVDYRLHQDQETSHRHQSLSKIRSERKDSIKEAKRSVESRNKINTLCIKAQKKSNELLLQKFKENHQNELHRHAMEIAKNENSLKNKRDVSSQFLVSLRESEYDSKLNNELAMQETLRKKLEDLSKLKDSVYVPTPPMTSNKICHFSCISSERSPHFGDGSDYPSMV